MTIFLPLYIDPGTGSMLFSLFIAVAAALSFLLRAVFLKAKFIFSGGKTGGKDMSAHPYVIYNEGNQYWTMFEPVINEFEKRKTPLLYLTSAKDDPAFSENYEFVKAEFIGEGNTAFARLNMLSADFLLATTPGLDVYQWKRSKRVKHYSHLVHGIGDVSTYRMFGLDFFDSILMGGDYQSKAVRALEKLRNLPAKDLCTVGSPYLDVLFEKTKNIPEEENHPFTVLLSPSWGPSGILKKYGEKILDPLVATGWRIIVRPHPQSKKSEAEMLEKLQARYKDNANVEWNYERDNIFVMKKADVMISDFSGIIFDYTFLFGKTLMCANADMNFDIYDAAWLKGDAPWHLAVTKKIGIELREEDFPKIKEIISAASDNAELAAMREKIKDEAWMFRGEAGKRIADFMIAKREEILSADEKAKGVA